MPNIKSHISVFLIAAMFALPAMAEDKPKDSSKDTPKAKFQVLNKINAVSSEVMAELDKETSFEDLKIALKRCHKAPELERKEDLALVKITDADEGNPYNSIFHGWMFSTDPAISAMEHPIYDVILLSCES